MSVIEFAYIPISVSVGDNIEWGGMDVLSDIRSLHETSSAGDS